MEYNNSGGALTDALSFVPKSPAAASRSIRTVITPINAGAQNPGDIMRFDIAVGRPNTFIDTDQTYISYQIVNNGVNAFNLDGSAYCVLKRLDTLSQGLPLESIAGYNVLVNTLMDAQMDATVASTSGTVNLGTGYDATCGVNVFRYGQAIAAGAKVDYCLPLSLSGVLGSGLTKYLPVELINDLRLELTLEAAAQAMVCGTVAAPLAASYQLQNVQLVLTYVSLDPAMAQQISQAVGGHYVLSSTSWRNFQTTLVAARSADSILIPAKYSSLRTLIHTFRDTAQQTNSGAYWLSARSNPFFSATGVLSSIQYSLGSTYVPATPMRLPSEIFISAQEAFHQIDSVTNGSRINQANWSQANYFDTNAYNMGTFFIGQNFDAFISKSATITCGFNSISTPTFLTLNYPAAVATAQRCDSFAHFDMVIDISAAGMVARY